MTRSKSIVPALFALAITFGLSAVAPAQAALITTSNFNPALNGSGTYTLGNLIQIGGTPITINALGVQDTAADGIIANTAVGIWTTGGTSPLASVTVPSGTSAILLNDYRYVLLGSPIVLAANTQYIIGAESATNGTKENAGEGFPGSIYSGDTGVTLLDSRFIAGGLAKPTNVGGTGATIGRWGHGNATFIAAVPTPAALPVGLGLMGLAAMRRGRRR